MQYIFLDTNIFIHFVDFEQINWHEVIESEDGIIIILAPIVIEELDKHKYNKNQKLSKRIKKLLPKIENLLESKTTCKYAIKFIDKRPIDKTFIDNKLNKTEQDDCLLATIIEYGKVINQGDRIVFITNDVGPRLKAKSLAIKTYKLSDNYLIANEPDETETKNILLQKELNTLKNSLPKVSLTFINREILISYKKDKSIYSKEKFIANGIQKVKTENPYLIFSEPDKDLYKNPILALRENVLLNLSEDQVNNYNKELDEYFIKFEAYLNSAFDKHIFNYHSIKIALLLLNNGTAPANDIDIEIHFPSGFELLSADGLPKIKKKPILPYRPKNRFDYKHTSFGSIFPSWDKPTQNFSIDQINLSHPTIKKTNSYDVSYYLLALKHNQTFDLEPLFAKFDDINTAEGFSIDYKLKISNVPNMIKGQLNIKFEE